LGEQLISTPPNNRQQLEVKQLLARLPVIRNGCDLDLLVFLYRHPRTLLTNEQIAAFVGRDTRQVAQSLDTFIEAGLLERTQNPTHAARMCLLQLDGSQGGGFKTILELASTREDGASSSSIWNRPGRNTEGHTQRLRLVKSACV
jgi:hypothetical protein